MGIIIVVMSTTNYFCSSVSGQIFKIVCLVNQFSNICKLEHIYEADTANCSANNHWFLIFEIQWKRKKIGSPNCRIIEVNFNENTLIWFKNSV